VIGVLNLDYAGPCPTHVTLAPGQTSSASCGGFDGRPWLIAGLVVIALTLLAFWSLNDPKRKDVRFAQRVS
jgi:hypothetical protein